MTEVGEVDIAVQAVILKEVGGGWTRKVGDCSLVGLGKGWPEDVSIGRCRVA